MADSRTEGPAIRPLPSLLGEASEVAQNELHRRLLAEGFDAIRPGHGCIFRFIDPDGSRLTTLSERAEMSKQACGEVVNDLEQLGYLKRVTDPNDGRAKIIRLTTRGQACRGAALRILAEVDREWLERFGAERVAILRAVLEELRAAEGSPLAA